LTHSEHLQLSDAIKQGDVLAVALLLECVGDISEFKDHNNGHWTALMHAVRHDHPEIVSMVLDKKSDVNQKDMLGWTALHFACYTENSIDTMHMLGINGADPNAKSLSGETPFDIACRYQRLDQVMVMIGMGADVNSRTDTQRTALHVAGYHGDIECIQSIVERGGDLNAQDERGYTALHLASERGHLGAVDVLLRLGAYSHIKSDTEGTALNIASRRGHYSVAHRLRNL